MTLLASAFQYTGDGVNDRVISIPGISSTPQLIIIKAQGASSVAWLWFDALPAGQSIGYNSASIPTDAIKSVGTTSMTVGTNAGVNTNAVVYNAIAIADPTGAFLRTGSYTGDGSDNRNISIGDTWTPDQVFVKRSATSAMIWRCSSHSGDASQTWGGILQADAIQGFSAGNFQVGTDVIVNASSGATTFYWIALKDCPNVLKTISYTGDGNDDRNITGAGFDPDALAFVKSPSTGTAGVLRFEGHSGDQSNAVNATAGVNQIQGFITDGIQVGTSTLVNANTLVFTGFVMRENLISGDSHTRTILRLSSSSSLIDS